MQDTGDASGRGARRVWRKTPTPSHIFGRQVARNRPRRPGAASFAPPRALSVVPPIPPPERGAWLHNQIIYREMRGLERYCPRQGPFETLLARRAWGMRCRRGWGRRECASMTLRTQMSCKGQGSMQNAMHERALASRTRAKGAVAHIARPPGPISPALNRRAGRT